MLPIVTPPSIQSFAELEQVRTEPCDYPEYDECGFPLHADDEKEKQLEILWENKTGKPIDFIGVSKGRALGQQLVNNEVENPNCWDKWRLTIGLQLSSTKLQQSSKQFKNSINGTIERADAISDLLDVIDFLVTTLSPSQLADKVLDGGFALVDHIAPFLYQGDSDPPPLVNEIADIIASVLHQFCTNGGTFKTFNVKKYLEAKVDPISLGLEVADWANKLHASLHLNIDTKNMNNLNIAHEYLFDYYMKGSDHFAVAESVGLSAYNHDEANIHNVIHKLAEKKGYKYAFKSKDYDTDAIVPIVEQIKSDVDKAVRKTMMNRERERVLGDPMNGPAERAFV